AGAGRQIAQEDAAVAQRLPQEAVISGARDLDCAELREMRRQELSIEHTVAAVPQPRDQMHEGDLARIGDAAEHALAEKGAAERDTVEPADQFDLVTALDAVRSAALEAAGVELQDHVNDPGIGRIV